VQEARYLEGRSPEPAPLTDIEGGRTLVMLGDSVTTDHISPAGSIPATSPAGQHLLSRGVEKVDFNSYGARRGNHEVLLRGTFGNIRLQNELAEARDGWRTRHQPSGDEMPIPHAAARPRPARVPPPPTPATA